MPKDLIKNDELVTAHYKNGTLANHQWGELKNEFIRNFISPIDKIYSHRLNKFLFVRYSPTKGFKYQVIR